MQVVLSGFIVRFLCFVPTKTLFMYGFIGCTRACVSKW